MSEAKLSLATRVQIAESRLDAVLSGCADGILFLDHDGRAVYLNPAAEFLLNESESKLLGEVVDVAISPETPTEANVISADGHVRVVELRVRDIEVPNDVARVVTIRDITHLKREAEQARGELRRRDEFVAMLSHELRNPLSALEHAVAVLKHDQAGKTARSQASTVLRTQFRHIKRMLDDLLDVTRLSQGKIYLQKEHVDMADVVRRAAEVLEPRLSAGDYRLKIDLGNTNVPCYVDSTRLHQVIVNLLTNAIQHSTQGSRILLSLARNGDQAVLSLRDYGFGIPPDLLPTIFEPFVQGQQELARSEGGLGVGLSLAKMIVELHAGTITAHSEGINRGTEFVITLPLSESAESSEAASAEDESAQGEKQVLVVEDNADTRSMLKMLLELGGYRVAEADNGFTGLSKLRTMRPRVAIVDIGLPGIDGYELAKQARQSLPPVRSVLLALTGYGRSEDREKSMAAGFDEHLVKPISFDDLDKALTRHLS